MSPGKISLIGAAICCLAAPAASSPAAGAGTAESTFCVDQINRLRSTIGVPHLVRSAAIEAFSNEAARVDGKAREAHKHFRATEGGHGRSYAQNEIPWWTLSRYGTVREVIRAGLERQWAEGPGGSHYENLAGHFTHVACGIAVLNGEVTVTQDFR